MLQFLSNNILVMAEHIPGLSNHTAHAHPCFVGGAFSGAGYLVVLCAPGSIGGPL